MELSYIPVFATLAIQAILFHISELRFEVVHLGTARLPHSGYPCIAGLAHCIYAGHSLYVLGGAKFLPVTASSKVAESVEECNGL